MRASLYKACFTASPLEVSLFFPLTVKYVHFCRLLRLLTTYSSRFQSTLLVSASLIHEMVRITNELKSWKHVVTLFVMVPGKHVGATVRINHLLFKLCSLVLSSSLSKRQR